MDVYENNSNPASTVFGDDAESKSSFLSKVFLYFGSAVLITAVVCIVISAIFSKIWPIYDSETSLNAYIALSTVGGIGLLITEIFIMFKSLRNRGSLLGPFILYSVFMGVLLSSLTFYIGDSYTIGIALFITSLMFFTMCGLGYLTHNKMNVYLKIFIGLMVVATLLCLVNFVILPFALYGGNYDAYYAYWRIYWIIEAVVILAYLFVTLFDMARIRKIAESGQGSNNVALYCALNLYSDFVVMFLYVLRFVVAIFVNSKRK